MERLRTLLLRALAAVLALGLLLCPVSAQDPEERDCLSATRIQGEPVYDLGETAVYVPLRGFMESLGVKYTIEWQEEERLALVRAPGLCLTVRAGDGYLTANERCIYLYGECLLLNGRLMVPIQALAKACGLEVVWDDAAQDARVEGSYSPILSGKRFYDETALYWLSRIIYAEAGIEELEGQIAVGNVVLNRVSRKYWPDSVYGVIFDQRFGVSQFTPAANGSIYQEPCALSVVAAKLALEGVSLAGDSLYFVNAAVGDEGWFRESCTYVTTIGRHSFYTQDIA